MLKTIEFVPLSLKKEMDIFFSPLKMGGKSPLVIKVNLKMRMTIFENQNFLKEAESQFKDK